MIDYSQPECNQRGTSACDAALVMVACRVLNMNLPSATSLPQYCQSVLNPPTTAPPTTAPPTTAPPTADSIHLLLPDFSLHETAFMREHKQLFSCGIAIYSY